MVAQCRNEFGHNARYPGLTTLIEELREDSEIFRRHWEMQEVSFRETGLRTFRHPIQGDVTFERTCLTLDASASFKLEVYIPVAPQAVLATRTHSCSRIDADLLRSEPTHARLRAKHRPQDE